MDYPAGAGPDGLAIWKFNGDKLSDLAVANLTGNTMSVLSGNGDGTFGAPMDFATGNFPLGIAVRGFRGRGTNKQDIVITNDLDKKASVFLNKSARSCN